MPRLTEQEQQEIIRFIEADKPLPDQYRFLLFEDKREVELVWNGKTDEICNIVLPFQAIELVDEPRAEKPEETGLQLELFRRARPPTQRLDQQANLGRQQADSVIAQERATARGDRGAGRSEVDLH